MTLEQAASVQAVSAALQAFAAICTFGAAAWAVKATYDAPRRAAELADELRIRGQALEETRTMQRAVLSTLLRYRRNMLHSEALAALNLIDFAFLHSQPVREAYQQFWQSIATNVGVELRQERYNKVIEAIVREMNLSNKITSSDI